MWIATLAHLAEDLYKDMSFLSWQRAEYDTPSNKETIPCHPTPPPVSPKMKTQDRPQPTWNTIESYDNRPYHPKVTMKITTVFLLRMIIILLY